MLDSNTMMERVAQGIETIPEIDDEKRRTAGTNIRLWLEDKRFAEYRSVLISFIEQEKWQLLLDCFYQTIPFGTGGRRGKVGIGTNRINPYMINSSVQGHCIYLKRLYPGVSDLSVVIAFDVRRFKDSAGIMPKGIPNPLIGMSSQDLAYSAAEVYAANGIRVYTIPPEDERYISTPELSFLIRKLKTYGGLNISASHNPPDDNGGKVYNRYGAQDIPPDDEELALIVAETRRIESLPFQQAVKKGLISFLKTEDRDAYIQTNLALTINPEARTAKIVYTPLHGTGISTVGKVLPAAGFNLLLEPTQATPDGDFPNVRFRVPNPEVPASMEKALAYAQEVSADLVLATDPDADRIGMMAPDRGGRWKFFNGNQIAILLTDYVIENRKRAGTLPADPVVVKTEVTSELIQRIADSNKVSMIGNLLVGFKYIAEVIQNLEKDDPRAADRFILGAEESHGILVTHQIRDKDAAGAALYLAELASVLKSLGLTFDDRLRSLYRKYGYFGNLLGSTVMTGAVGMAKIAQIQTELRRNPPTMINALKVVSFVDHQDQNGRLGPFKSETDRSARNVVVMTLENGCRVILRPSGTEPKIKVYFELGGAPVGEQADDSVLDLAILKIDHELQEIYQSFMLFILRLIDIELPLYALAVSDLVSLDCKLDFARKFLPEFKNRVRSILKGVSTTNEVNAWIDSHLTQQGYGKDPRGLLVTAIDNYITSALLKADAEQTRILTMMRTIFHGLD